MIGGHFFMNRKPTYEELEKKVAQLQEALAQCRHVEKDLKLNLAENEEGPLRVMFDILHDNALLLDLDGRVLAINTPAAHGLGKEPDEIVGRSIYDFLPEKVVAFRKEQAMKVASEKRPVTFSEESRGIILDWKIYPVFLKVDRWPDWRCSAGTSREVSAWKHNSRRRVKWMPWALWRAVSHISSITHLRPLPEMSA